MKRGTIEHPKTRRLMRLLEIPRYAAVGLLESMWHATAKWTPRGDLGQLSDQDIADALEWEGDATELITALLTAGWLDPSEEYRLLVHHWIDHVDHTTRRKLKANGTDVIGAPTPADDDRNPVSAPENEDSADNGAQPPLPARNCAQRRACLKPVASSQKPTAAAHGPRSDEPPPADDAPAAAAALAALVGLGFEPDDAAELARRHPPDVIQTAVRNAGAKPRKNPRGYVVAAIRGRYPPIAATADVREERRRDAIDAESETRRTTLAAVCEADARADALLAGMTAEERAAAVNRALAALPPKIRARYAALPDPSASSYVRRAIAVELSAA
jgi:hypothetical protein